MWHVMQVRSRKEKEIVDLVRKSPVGSYTGECFLPRYERKRRYREEGLGSFGAVECGAE